MNESKFKCGWHNFLLVAEPQVPSITPKLAEPSDAIKVYREVMEGQHVLLPCVAQGYPVPEST